MLTAAGLKIKMVEGDYGLVLPIKLLTEQAITASDKFAIKIFKDINTEPLVSQEYYNLTDNTIEFKLSEEESHRLKVGYYKYDIDWYRDNTFLSNVVAQKAFIVSEKAGVVSGSEY